MKKLFAVFMVVAMTMCYMPFMSFADMPTENETDAGVVFTKNAEKTSDGNVKITLEAYTTGRKVVSTDEEPVDIVLVLDQSGSMKDEFSNGITRQAAMKDAVKSFVTGIDGEGGHRISVVTFGSSADILKKWTEINENGKEELLSAINGLPDRPSGATNISAGMTSAKNLMDAGKGSRKVVIVFTDGVPTTRSDFDTEVADSAINTAKAMKDAGTDIYTIGVFKGADPAQLYGDKWNYELSSDIECSGEVGSYWGGSWLNSLFAGNDFEAVDVPAGNRFLNYLSSNYDAETFGAERGSYNPGDRLGGAGTGYRIVKNAALNGGNYYLSANSAEGLTQVFEQIQSETVVPSVELDGSTVITDEISEYFSAPEHTSVNVYTADYLGNGQFSEKTETELSAEVNGKRVSVSGFNFNENFISEPEGTAEAKGKKLIIEFTVKPDYDQIDNNIVSLSQEAGVFSVPTNENAQILKGTQVIKEAPSGAVDMYSVTYKTTEGTVEKIHKTQLRMSGADVEKLDKLPGYSDWTTEDVTVGTDDCFMMPEKNIVFTAVKNEESKPEEKPAAPEATDIENLYGRVQVKCVIESAGHQAQDYTMDTFAIGEVQGENGVYAVELTLSSEPYIAKYNNDFGENHTLIATDESEKKLTAVYNADSGKWVIAEGSKVIFCVECSAETDPENPGTPDYPHYYNVRWNNYDSVTLESDWYLWGEMPVYDGTVPVKTADDQYTYVFSGWDRAIEKVTGDTVYTAQFKAVPKEPVSPEKPDQPEIPGNPDTPDEPSSPDTPENPDKPDTPADSDRPDIPDQQPDSQQEIGQNSDIPKTGDAQNMGIWIVLFAATVSALGITLKVLGKRK